MRNAVCALVLLAGAASAEDKPAVRELAIKGVTGKYDNVGGAPKPVEVTSADELAQVKQLADDASRDALKKQLDFAKEKLVLCVWQGSGRDRLVLGGDAKEATLTYSAGETDDLRRHLRAFAVPKDAKVKVVSK